MKKENFLRQFVKEQEYLAIKLYNYYETAQDYEIVSFTEEFYTPNFWKKLGEKFGGVNVVCDGVFVDSDRRQIAFIPDSFMNENDNLGFENNENDLENFRFNQNVIQFPNKLLKIAIDSRFYGYLHKDFLGSLMGLNVKRELMGDLIIESCDKKDKRIFGYIPVSEKIVDYIISELKQIGRATCEIEVVDIKDKNNLPKYKYDDKLITVQSKRLDSIVSTITNLSRTKVIEPIEKGQVLVDYVEEKDKSKLLEIGSLITIRGFGKYKLFLDKGETKKGKERILVKKYI
ncbi:RNA-binding S4 domain-containing protein [Leptotrichia shahii]|uniref:RNA-binding S4 domain-containing protein n=1 Tax=Leptotrichia shahii TaxID=157691 RepID=A0A510JQQ5_9FUSO|nr:YlmH/Sll1252 family protein [Leptotrichia shahii]BBM40771.1 RNA-binding S4 domain-containing protein [Leptotrichia shahii]